MKSRLGTQVFVSYSRNAPGASGWTFDSDLEFYRRWCDQFAFDDWFRKSGSCSFVSRASIQEKSSIDLFLRHSKDAIHEAFSRQTIIILLIDLRKQKFSNLHHSDQIDLERSCLLEAQYKFSSANVFDRFTESQRSMVRHANNAFGYLSGVRRKRVFVMFNHMDSDYAVSGDQLDMIRSRRPELDIIHFKEFSDDYSRQSEHSWKSDFCRVDRNPFEFIEDGNVFSFQRARKRILDQKNESGSRDPDFKLSSRLDDILPDL